MHPTKSVRNDCGNGCSSVHQKQPSGGQLGSHGLEPDEREIHMRERAFEVDDERHATMHWANHSPLSMGINQFSPSVELYLLYKCAKGNISCVDSGQLEMCKTDACSDICTANKVVDKTTQNTTYVMSQFPALAYRQTCTLHFPPL